MAEYPAKITGTDITANLDGEHYNITSPRDCKDIVSALPGAKWDAQGRVWQVKKRWHRKVAEMIAARDAELAETRARLAEDATASGVDLAGYSWCQPSQRVPGAWIIRTPWIDGLAQQLRAIGAEWIADAKVWRVPAGRTPDLKLSAAALDAVIAPALAREAKTQEAREAVKAAEAQARAEARVAEDAAAQYRRWWRILCHADYNPGVGAVVKWRGAWRVIEGHGKWFRAGDDLSSMGYPDLTGDQVRYAYTRAATEAEIAQAETAEAAARAEASRREGQQAAIAQVAAGEPAPAAATEPAGEVIWRDDTHAATGYRCWIVLGLDGWLYHLTYDGSDGAAWGYYNAGCNTRAARVPADPALIDAIKGGRP